MQVTVRRVGMDHCDHTKLPAREDEIRAVEAILTATEIRAAVGALPCPVTRESVLQMIDVLVRDRLEDFVRVHG